MLHGFSFSFVRRVLTIGSAQQRGLVPMFALWTFLSPPYRLSSKILCVSYCTRVDCKFIHNDRTAVHCPGNIELFTQRVALAFGAVWIVAEQQLVGFKLDCTTAAALLLLRVNKLSAACHHFVLDCLKVSIYVVRFHAHTIHNRLRICKRNFKLFYDCF